MELRLGDRLKRTKRVDAGVVDQDVEPAKVVDSCVDQDFVLRLGNVAANGDGLSAGLGDGLDDGSASDLLDA